MSIETGEKLSKLLEPFMKPRGSWTIDSLARTSNVSNNSIIMITSGKWPEKQRTLIARSSGKRKNREIANWACSISRLAVAVGQKPEEWVIAAGLPYDRSALFTNSTKSVNIAMQEVALMSQMSTRLITLEDLALIESVIKQVGGGIPLGTALSLLSSRDLAAKKSS